MAEKEKYCYSFDGETYRGEFNTKEEALAYVMEKNYGREYVYIGIIDDSLNAATFVDIDDLLDDAGAAAQDTCGEVAEEYLSHWSEREKEELKKIICEYLDKVDPVTFYTVERIAKFRVVDGKAIEDTEVSL